MKKIIKKIGIFFTLLLLCVCSFGCETGGNVGLDSVKISVEKSETGDSYSVTGIGTHTAEELTIPSSIDGIPVVAIQSSAFIRSNLKKVIIPASVKVIEGSAFMQSTSLESVEMHGVETLGERAFFGCLNLKTVSIASSVRFIGVKAFTGCKALEKNTYDNANYLGNASDPYVVLMEAVDQEIASCKVSEGCKILYHGCFQNCLKLQTVEFAEVTTQFGNDCFNTCIELTHPVFPRDLEVIGDSAFRSCAKLLSITIDVKLRKVGDYAFLAGEEYSCDIDHVYYRGTKGDWGRVEINVNVNNNLNVNEVNPRAAKWHYSHEG